MTILGIDPGSTRIGYGLIEKKGDLRMKTCGTIEIVSKAKPDRVTELVRRFSALIAKAKPDLAGLEKLYFAKNQKTALDVSEARGIMYSLLLKAHIPVYECRPAEVKLMVANYAFADKQAVAKMVAKILGIPALAGHDDTSDALAIAITAAGQFSYQTRIA